MNPNMDMDPLSTYEYPTYENYPSASNPALPFPPPVYPYDIKVEPPIANPTFLNHFMNTIPDSNDKILTNLNDTNRNNENAPMDVDIKPDISLNFNTKNGKKEKKKKSSYWSEKINDENFKFYGCAICSVSFTALAELDQHVTIHKDRLTSYDLKIKNLIKRKKMKKEQKKMKKLGKVKTEEITLEIEIKPEDGYIGNKETSKYNDGNNENLPSNKDEDKNEDKDSKEDICKENITNNDTGNSSSLLNGTDKQSLVNLEKIYKCFACQKQFSLSYYLKLHVRSHTDEKPYTCSICGQSFITASKLGRHNKRIHLAVRYQCRICYRFYSKFENLTTHFDKKHADDKLEGEPYDYNAILPYLKELEEELREKAQKDSKPKPDDWWQELWGTAGPPPGTDDGSLVPKNETPEEQPNPFLIDVLIEEVKVDPPDVEIKKEPEDAPALDAPGGDDERQSDDEHKVKAEEKKKTQEKKENDDDEVKDERYSDDDDDYFPSNTWAASPKIEDPPPSPKTRKGKASGPLQCSVCEKKVSTASYLRVHMRTHTGERPFKCYICKRGFITSSKMHRHVLTHSETWEGDEAQVKMEEIKEDPGEQDGEEKKRDTKELIKKAKAKFNKKSKRDKMTTYKKRPHACEFCHKRFLHLETLQVHKKSHEGEELILKCLFCLEVMTDEASLKEHEATHAGPKPYLCTICGKGYKKRETMVYHRKHHKPDKDYICNVCSKSFNAPCKLQRHLVSHRADKFVLRYECPVCAHMFNTKYHVQMHLATHQKEGLIDDENRNEILAMVLQNARKIPKQSDSSQTLTDLIPADERSRVCNICGEVFQHFYYLEEHLKGHGSKIAIEDMNKTEEKKHVCQVCNKSFKLHYYLKLHSFTHTKEKPYICQQCGKGFITKGKLKRHLETHTGLKKYQCHICYKFFTRTSYLRIHVRTIHGNQDYNFRLEKEYGLASLDSLPVMSQSSI